MIAIGMLHPTEGVPIAPDTMANYVTTAAGIYAKDWPSSAQMVRFRGASTAGAAQAFAVNMWSTKAAWPAATVEATTNSSALNTLVSAGYELIYQIPKDSTGFSLSVGSCGIITAEFWKK